MFLSHQMVWLNLFYHQYLKAFDVEIESKSGLAFHDLFLLFANNG